MTRPKSKKSAWKHASGQVLQDVLSLMRQWRNPKDPYRQKAVDLLRNEWGYPRYMADQILNRLFSKSNEAVLKSLANNKFGCVRGTAGFIFPSNVPDPLVEEVLSACAEGRTCLVKLSRNGRKFGELFIRSVQKRFKRLGLMIRCVPQKEFFKHASNCATVTAYGDDASLDRIAKKLPANVSFIRKGHCFSIGVIFKDRLKPENFIQTARQCAMDVWLYDQQGCLSPQVFFVEEKAERFAKELKNQLDSYVHRFGPIKRSYERSLKRHVFMNRLVSESFREHGPRIIKGSHERGEAAVYESRKNPFVPGPGGQVVAVRPMTGLSDIRREVKPYWDKLQSVGYGGTGDQGRVLKKCFIRTTVKRVCPVGRMQKPQWGWDRSKNDGGAN